MTRPLLAQPFVGMRGPLDAQPGMPNPQRHPGVRRGPSLERRANLSIQLPRHRRQRTLRDAR